MLAHHWFVFIWNQFILIQIFIYCKCLPFKINNSCENSTNPSSLFHQSYNFEIFINYLMQTSIIWCHLNIKNNKYVKLENNYVSCTMFCRYCGLYDPWSSSCEWVHSYLAKTHLKGWTLFKTTTLKNHNGSAIIWIVNLFFWNKLITCKFLSTFKIWCYLIMFQKW